MCPRESDLHDPTSDGADLLIRGGALLAIVVTAVAVAVTSGSASAAVGWRAFQTPSGNIRCEFTGHGAFFVRCGRLNDGLTLELGDVGRAARNDGAVHGVASRYRHPLTLRYGMRWSNAVWHLSCVSRSTGLARANKRHGFSLSRDAVRTW
jgi:hypothetical protein